MPQSDGRTKLKRIEIDFGNKTYKFNINPEEYSQDEPSRSTVTQTKGGAFIDDFGNGLQNIFIKGSTGFERGLGVDKYKELRDRVREYYEQGKLGSSPENEIIFHNFTDDESWVVHTDPSGIRLLRNKNNPLLYMYELKFICLRPAKYPASRAKTGGVNRTVGVNKALTTRSSATSLEVAKDNLVNKLNVLNGSIPVSLSSYLKELEVLGSSLKNFQNLVRDSM